MSHCYFLKSPFDSPLGLLSLGPKKGKLSTTPLPDPKKPQVSVNQPTGSTIQFTSDTAKTMRFVGGRPINVAGEREENIRAYRALRQALLARTPAGTPGTDLATQNRQAKSVRGKSAAADAKKYTMKLGTGGSFSRTVRGGSDRQMRTRALGNRSTFKNLSKGDQKILGDLIEKHAARLPTGVGYRYADRKRMKEEVDRLWRKEFKISQADAADFKKIIDLLE